MYVSVVPVVSIYIFVNNNNNNNIIYNRSINRIYKYKRDREFKVKKTDTIGITRLCQAC